MAEHQPNLSSKHPQASADRNMWHGSHGTGRPLISAWPLPQLSPMKALHGWGWAIRGGSNAFNDGRDRLGSPWRPSVMAQPAAAKKSKMGCEIGKEVWDASDRASACRAPMPAKRKRARLSRDGRRRAHVSQHVRPASSTRTLSCGTSRLNDLVWAEAQDVSPQHAHDAAVRGDDHVAPTLSSHSMHAFRQFPVALPAHRAPVPFVRLARGEALRVPGWAARSKAHPPNARS